MKKYLYCAALALALFAPTSVFAQDANNGLTFKTQIDSAYVFAFDLRESRSAKGGIWSIKEGKFVTPQNFSEAKTDTINGQPVVKLYRQVGLGNHPLNGWETWINKDCKWIRMDEAMDRKDE